MIVTGEQLRAARSLIRAEQDDLASWSRVSVDTIKRLERTVGEVSANISTINAVVSRLSHAGVEFICGAERGVKIRKDILMTEAQFWSGLEELEIWRFREYPEEIAVERFEGQFVRLMYRRREIGTAAQHTGGVHFRPRISLDERWTPGEMFEDWAKRAYAAANTEAP